MLMNDMTVRSFNCVEKRQADRLLLEAGLSMSLLPVGMWMRGMRSDQEPRKAAQKRALS